MNMIRHNYIATYCDVVGLLGTLRKKNERSMNLVVCQEPLSCVRAERDEIKRTSCEDPSQTWWSQSESPLHGKSVATALRAVQSKDVMPLVPITGHRPVATGACVTQHATVSSNSSSTFFALSKFMMHFRSFSH